MKIIDEDGLPVVDGNPSGKQFGAGPAGGMPGSEMPGMPGMAGLPPIPEELLNRKGKLSLAKVLGWKGIAFLGLIVAGLIALAAASFVVALIAVPVLLVMGAIGWVAAKVRGPKATAAGPRAVVVVRPQPPQSR